MAAPPQASSASSSSDTAVNSSPYIAIDQPNYVAWIVIALAVIFAGVYFVKKKKQD